MRTYAEWFEIADVAIRHLGRERWFVPGLAREAALAATGKLDNAGISALCATIESGTRVAPTDDPHDGWKA